MSAVVGAAWLQQTAQPRTNAMEAEPDDLTERIGAMRAGGASLNAIQRELFGYVGGKAYEAVRAAVHKAESAQGS